MPRPKNPVPSEQLRITITPQLRDELELLVHTGRYGTTVSEAIHRLLTDAVDGAVARGKQFMENKAALAGMVRTASRQKK